MGEERSSIFGGCFEATSKLVIWKCLLVKQDNAHEAIAAISNKASHQNEPHPAFLVHDMSIQAHGMTLMTAIFVHNNPKVLNIILILLNQKRILFNFQPNHKLSTYYPPQKCVPDL